MTPNPSTRETRRQQRFTFLARTLPALGANPNATLGEKMHALHVFGGHQVWERQSAPRNAVQLDAPCGICVLTKRAGTLLDGPLADGMDRGFESLKDLADAGMMDSLEDMRHEEVVAVFAGFTRLLNALGEFCQRARARHRPLRSVLEVANDEGVARGRLSQYSEEEFSSRLSDILDLGSDEEVEALVGSFQDFVTSELQASEEEQIRARMARREKSRRMRALLIKIETMTSSIGEEDLKALEGESCVVCQSAEFVVKDSVTRLQCKHVFHKSCISPWLVSQAGSCPICRREV